MRNVANGQHVAVSLMLKSEFLVRNFHCFYFIFIAVLSDSKLENRWLLIDL